MCLDVPRANPSNGPDVSKNNMTIQYNSYMSLSSCRAPNLLLHTTGCLIALVVDRGSTRDTLYTEQQIRTGIWQPVRLLGACDDRMMTAHIESSNILKNHLKTLAGECLHIPGVRGRVIICPLDNVSPSRFLHIPAVTSITLQPSTCDIL